MTDLLRMKDGRTSDMVLLPFKPLLLQNCLKKIFSSGQFNIELVIQVGEISDTIMNNMLKKA